MLSQLFNLLPISLKFTQLNNKILTITKYFNYNIKTNKNKHLYQTNYKNFNFYQNKKNQF